MKLSPKHGLNPTVGICYFCGEDSGELALLGRLPSDAEAPRFAILSDEPCPSCKTKLDSFEYVAFDCVRDPSHRGLVKRSALERILIDSDLSSSTKRVRFEKCPSCLGLIEGTPS